MKTFLKFLLDRLRERSTWLGIISLLTALGIILTPEQSDAVIASGISVAGLIATFSKDTKS